MDPFATLGIDRRFDVDLNATEKRYRELSRTLHPDRYTHAGPSERRAALSKAVEVNEAWRTLKDPITRAEALFSLAGVTVGERNEPAPSPALLMEAMELRETLAEAKDKKDLAAIEHLAGEVDARRRDVEEKLRAGFAASAADKRKVTALVPLLGELRFHRRFLDEVSAIEDALAESAVVREA
ncbi:MAG TPA: Fe-S protein assembly co-chaperone HscB [Polyangiaceae bacterium]|jgi:molecular chaperone HscB